MWKLTQTDYTTHYNSRYKQIMRDIFLPGYSKSVEIKKGCTTTFRGLWTLGWTAFCAKRSTADVGLTVVCMGFFGGG